MSTATNEEVFTDIYDNDRWGGGLCKSGTGSLLGATVALRRDLPQLFRTLGIRTFVDAPCGVGTWMRELAPLLDAYVGIDVVKAAIDAQLESNPPENMRFLHGDITTCRIPRADAILCRDCLVHLDNDLSVAAIRNFKRSGAKYLFVTHFDDGDNKDIKVGNWRRTNFRLAPFNFPEPVATIVEDEKSGKKVLGFRLDRVSI